MTNYYITETLVGPLGQKNATSKARDDIDAIMATLGWQHIGLPVTSYKRAHCNAVQGFKFHVQAYRNWGKTLKHLTRGDTLLIQFPPREHSIFLSAHLKRWQQDGIRIFLVIHDIETVRTCLCAERTLKFKLRSRLEEASCLDCCDAMIVHNHAMAKLLINQSGISAHKVVELGIFDYLVPTDDESGSDERLSVQENRSAAFADPHKAHTDFRSVIIAGNLIPEKAAYLAKLPKGLCVNLYGLGYEGRVDDDIRYVGAFSPDELPRVLSGGFGLVWDGESTDTCTGAYGEYLRYNNPHKLSLYLACGIPVVIWQEAALASFVTENGCGIAVASLSEAKDRLAAMSKAEYQTYAKHAAQVSEGLRMGIHTTAAVEECLKRAAAVVSDATASKAAPAAASAAATATPDVVTAEAAASAAMSAAQPAENLRGGASPLSNPPSSACRRVICGGIICYTSAFASLKKAA